MKGFRFRLWRRFTLQYAIILFVTSTLLFTIIMIFGFYLTTQERRSDFYDAGLESLSFSVSTEYEFSGELSIIDELQEEADARNGWFQIVNEDGTVADTYPAGEGFAQSYTLQELQTIVDAPIVGNYHMYTSYFQVAENTYFLLYGEERVTNELLATFIEEGNTSEVLQQFDQHDAWGYVFNDDELVNQLRAPEWLRQPSFGGVMLHQIQPESVDAYVQIAESDGLTYVVYAPIPELPFRPLNEIGSTLLIVSLVILGIAILVFAVASLWFTRTFTKPIYGAINWLDQLGDGDFTPPAAFGKTKKGEWKRPYRFYQELYHSLSKLSAQLEHNKAKRIELEASREAWIAGLSHDMKTPLSSIQGYSIMLSNKAYEWDSEEIIEVGAILNERSSFMSTLIEDLNLTYHLESNRMFLQKKTVPLEPLLNKSIEAFEHTGKAIVLNHKSTNLIVDVDPKWFVRMIGNVLDNAIKHNNPDTHVRVRTERVEKNTLTVHIIDNGKGMNEETLTKLFDRYYRGKSSQERTEGSGLGMTITKELVHHHGGSIDVTSKPGKGTTVSIHLPIEDGESP
ncbi:HAMP domain-containing sensor histidine kinase [Geomicrobium sp. JCM 19039]|uniref:sensor histidine kinase n=1 Tax=Geomicrobium sp. JCM 19039 TaxID=1460636 RepID=UPI0009DEBE19|nr:HAMP domain-containing sensor histidine kinase [Geomicrobium sp. JCM 19039]